MRLPNWNQAKGPISQPMVGVLSHFYTRHHRNWGGRRNASLSRRRRWVRAEIERIRAIAPKRDQS
jgi:hypothetical protein